MKKKFTSHLPKDARQWLTTIVAVLTLIGGPVEAWRSEHANRPSAAVWQAVHELRVENGRLRDENGDFRRRLEKLENESRPTLGNKK